MIFAKKYYLKIAGFEFNYLLRLVIIILALY